MMVDTREIVKIYLDETAKIRDVWAKKDIGYNDIIMLNSFSHTVRIFRVSNEKQQ